MALPINIDELLNAHVVESTRIEFKADWNPNPIIHTICAFANDIDNIGGGYLVIGVEEQDGMPVLPPKGIAKNKVDSILKKLVGLCHKIEPLYNPIVEPVFYKDAYIIVIWVPGGHGRPYKASKDVLAKNSPKHYYIRKFASTIVASPDEEKQLFYVSTDIPFDDRPNLLASVNDLDIALMRQHLKAIGSDLYALSFDYDTLELAQDLQLVSGPPENLHPLNVGILMFCETPERFFRYARIEVVDIPDPTGQNMVEKTFTGPIQRQLSDALAYLKNYAVKEAVIKTDSAAESKRIANYPIKAIEEVLANAVYHRSYQINEPIVVRITPKSIEITSFPGFDRSISDKSIAEFNIRARVYRNRRIGDFLKELGFIEGRNTGFPNAIEALKRNGSGELSFEMDKDRNFISVTIPVHPHFGGTSIKNSKELEYESRIIDALGNSTMSKNQLANAMGYKGITAKLSKTVDKLLAEKKLETLTVGSQVKLRVHKNKVIES